MITYIYSYIYVCVRVCISMCVYVYHACIYTYICYTLVSIYMHICIRAYGSIRIFFEHRGCPVRNADPSPIMELARRQGVTTFKGGGRKRRGICATILSSACVCIGTYPLNSQVATRVGKSACADYWRL